MFYEGRIQKVKMFESLESLLASISEGFYYDLLYCFEQDGKLFGLANDEISCESVTEAAIFNLTDRIQIESVTIGWMNKENWLNYFTRLFKSRTVFAKPLDFAVIEGKIVWTKVHLAHFECGCCGQDFKSDYQYQQQFDQDAGYGICPDCE